VTGESGAGSRFPEYRPNHFRVGDNAALTAIAGAAFISARRMRGKQPGMAIR
jgi:hypothetical protein